MKLTNTMKTTITATLALAALAANGLAREPEFALHDGERVVLLGDSITEQNLSVFSGLIGWSNLLFVQPAAPSVISTARRVQ